MKKLRWLLGITASLGVAAIIACSNSSAPGDNDQGNAGGTDAPASQQADAPDKNNRNSDPPYLITEGPIKWDIGNRGGQFIYSSISPPKSFNEVVSSESSTSEVLGYIYEGLTTADPVTGEVIPNLAKSWTISDDGLTYTFVLRDDVKWNDGEPFTAEDVEYTFNDLYLNDDIPAPMRDLLTIEGKKVKTTAIDEHTVQFTLPTKFAPFLRLVGTAILPKHVVKPYVDAGTFSESFGVDSKPEEIVGTGPFMLEKYMSGQRVIFKRNPYYWKKDEAGNQLPYLDRVIIEIVKNQDAALLKFKQNELDYYALRGQDYPDLKPGEKNGNYKVYMTGVSRGSQFLFFNQNTGTDENGKPYVDPIKLKWFRNVNFRKAVAFAIDKQSLINVQFNGLAVPQWSPVGPGSPPFHNPDVKKYPYDPEKAKQILAENGFTDQDGDGFLEDAEGHTVKFNLTTNSESTDRIAMAQMIVRDLKNIGFDVSFLPLQFNLLVNELDSSYHWEAMILGLTGGIEPHFGKNVWDSAGFTHMWFPRQEKPSTDWEARIDQLFNRGVQELDHQKRKAIYDEWQQIVADKLPFIYTVLQKNMEAVRNDLGNVRPTKYAGALHSIERVYIK